MLSLDLDSLILPYISPLSISATAVVGSGASPSTHVHRTRAREDHIQTKASEAALIQGGLLPFKFLVFCLFFLHSAHLTHRHAVELQATEGHTSRTHRKHESQDTDSLFFTSSDVQSKMSKVCVNAHLRVSFTLEALVPAHSLAPL